MANHDFFDSELFQELVSDLHEEARFTATYRVEAEDFTEAKERAKEIAYEQTVECPQELIAGTWIESRVIGHVEDIKKAAPGVWYVYISYLPEAVESDFTELLNMLFGNISLLPGIRLMSFDLPEAFLSTFNGPKLGQGGIRELCGVESGPILMSAVKPLGRSSEELAAMVSALALGGCPIIKDDHSLFDQKWAPFEERVHLCADACAEANEKTGGSSIFVANCTGDGLAFLDRAYKAQELGAGGIMAAPGLLGFSLIKQLADAPDFQLPIFLHPCFTGSITMHEDSGISPFCWYGQICRLAGADAVIFTSFGGRFTHSEQDCALIAESLNLPMGQLRSPFPVPSGGMKRQLFRRMRRVYGDGTIFLVGGALQTEGPDLTENTKIFLQSLREA